MLSRALLRDRPDEVRELLATRGVEPELFNTWEELDPERRDILVEVEELKRRRNEASKEATTNAGLRKELEITSGK